MPAIGLNVFKAHIYWGVYEERAVPKELWGADPEVHWANIFSLPTPNSVTNIWYMDDHSKFFFYISLHFHLFYTFSLNFNKASSFQIRSIIRIILDVIWK